MGDPNTKRVEDLFHAAAELQPAQRAAYLERACAGDVALQREVESLLAGDERASALFDRVTPALSRAADVHGLRLAAGQRVGPYVLTAEIASGGMGSVWRAERADREFERVVAIKVLRPSLASANLPARFEHERRTLARLEHAHIAQLYDAGETGEGISYLVMEYVDGEPIDVHCDRLRLTLRERLQLVCTVASAVQAAHERFVVHRDLKPENILVTRDGSPKLIDFGIAKLLEQDEAGKAALTRTGVRPMTPRYASPEQVRGEGITTASDVYSLGVVMYELLCGTGPYPLAAKTAHELETAILDTDPARPSAVATDADTAERRATTTQQLARELRGDLDAILLTALRKEPERRYRSARELALDIERWLTGRPVAARPDTIRYKAQKLIGRHKLGTALALVAVVGLGIALGLFVRSARIAEQRLGEVLRLSDLARLDDYTAAAEELWPADPEHVPGLSAWLERARLLLDNLPEHRQTLAALRAVGRPQGESFVFADIETQWQYQKTAELVDRLAAFGDPASGLFAGVEARLERAQTLSRDSIQAHATEWRDACAAIADEKRSPLYHSLTLVPQLGLVPLGPDPDSGLWEFAHIASGTVPARAVDGRLAIAEENAIVLVLIPGGTFRMGAEPPGPDGPTTGPNIDASATEPERPVNEVALDPFLISKYEMTQAQWVRAAGANPSRIQPGDKHGKVTTSALHPVEYVSWLEAARIMHHLGLALPTEAQWEYAARAGTTTRWWTGDERETLRGAANIADQSAARAGAPWISIRDWPEFDDGFVVHAPVNTLLANPFGLHHVHGNVWEWCADRYINYTRPTRAGDGWREFDGPGTQVGRGGSFTMTSGIARVSNRGPGPPTQRDETIGLRPARALTR